MISFEHFVVEKLDTLRFRCYESCNCHSMIMTIQAIYDTINNAEFNFFFVTILSDIRLFDFR